MIAVLKIGSRGVRLARHTRVSELFAIAKPAGSAATAAALRDKVRRCMAAGVCLSSLFLLTWDRLTPLPIWYGEGLPLTG